MIIVDRDAAVTLKVLPFHKGQVHQFPHQTRCNRTGTEPFPLHPLAADVVDLNLVGLHLLPPTSSHLLTVRVPPPDLDHPFRPHQNSPILLKLHYLQIHLTLVPLEFLHSFARHRPLHPQDQANQGERVPYPASWQMLPGYEYFFLILQSRLQYALPASHANTRAHFEQTRRVLLPSIVLDLISQQHQQEKYPPCH